MPIELPSPFDGASYDASPYQRTPEADVAELPSAATSADRVLVRCVERLVAEQQEMRRELLALQRSMAERPCDDTGALAGESAPLSALSDHRWTPLAHRGRRSLWLARAAGLRGALGCGESIGARRAVWLGPLEQGVLALLLEERARDPMRCIPAKVLAIELCRRGIVPASGQPAPGTVRSAWTRLRKKVQSLGGSADVLVGGRPGYRLGWLDSETCPV